MYLTLGRKRVFPVKKIDRRVFVTFQDEESCGASLGLDVSNIAGIYCNFLSSFAISLFSFASRLHADLHFPGLDSRTAEQPNNFCEVPPFLFSTACSAIWGEWEICRVREGGGQFEPSAATKHETYFESQLNCKMDMIFNSCIFIHYFFITYD